MSSSAEEGTPFLSVVIPHYGDPAHALTLIDDLRGQLPSGEGQIVVVDDCSPQPFPQTTGVTVVRRATNGGFGAAVNAGASIAEGDWLLISNSDLRIPSPALPRLLSAARVLMPAIVGPDSVDLDGRSEYPGRHFPNARQLAVTLALPLQRFSGSRWHLGLSGRVLPRGSEPRRVDWLSGSCLLLPRREFAAVGGFDEGYFMYSEEVDLQRRLAEVGVHAWLLPEIVVTHEGGASSYGIDVGERMMRSRLLYAAKFGGESSLRRTLRAVAVLNLGCRLLLRAAGRPSAPRRAWQREWSRATMQVDAVPTAERQR